MSKSRPAVLVLLLVAVAALLAACGDDDSTDSASSESVSLDDCTPDTLETSATARSRSPPTSRPSRPTSRTTTRPTARASRAPSATRSPTSSATPQDQVEWTVEPFNSSYAPGPKDFDFDLNQISITDKRAEAVDFSSPYYTADQAVVAHR